MSCPYALILWKTMKTKWKDHRKLWNIDVIFKSSKEKSVFLICQNMLQLKEKTEAAVRKILQNSQENTCVEISF